MYLKNKGSLLRADINAKWFHLLHRKKLLDILILNIVQ